MSDDDSEGETLPLFPLRSVVFPRGRLALQIFERRYIDLVTRSLRDGTGFGITLLKEGPEVAVAGSRQTLHRTGMRVRIVDWDALPNGLLGITVEGVKKFRVLDCWVAENDLFMARVRYCPHDTIEEPRIPLQSTHQGMAELLQALEQHPAVAHLQLEVDHDNLWDLGWRLSELIPLDLETRQALLELDDPWERMLLIERAIQDLADER